MVAVLARATGADPVGLWTLLHEEPDVFDSIWYGAFPPKRPGFDVDEVLGR